MGTGSRCSYPEYEQYQLHASHEYVYPLRACAHPAGSEEEGDIHERACDECEYRYRSSELLKTPGAAHGIQGKGGDQPNANKEFAPLDKRAKQQRILSRNTEHEVVEPTVRVVDRKPFERAANGGDERVFGHFFPTS